MHRNDRFRKLIYIFNVIGEFILLFIFYFIKLLLFYKNIKITFFFFSSILVFEKKIKRRKTIFYSRFY